MTASKRSAILFLAVGLAAAVFVAVPAPAEDAAARADRLNGLIESLNASSERRARVLESIYNELRGPDTREMQEMLRESLFRSNSLILQGVIEAMAMQGDARDMASLEALLATSDKLEVKVLILRLLPAFTLGSERARFNYINYAAGYSRVPHPSVLPPLRRPPLTRRGRLDPAQERLQNRVVRILCGQFDPVGAALRYLDDRLYGQAARRVVVHYVGNGLGNDPGRWARIWAAQGESMASRAPEEVEEIRLAALLSLSDMGAEGLPEVIAAFRRLLSAGGPILEQASFEAMAAMCRNAFGEFADLSAMNFDAEDAVEAENWRNRRFASAAGMGAFAAGSACDHLVGGMDAGGFVAAADCLGAALSYPDAFPDPDGRLAAARAGGLTVLEHLLLMPDLGREKRSAAAAALGVIGAERAVAALAGILDSPYASPDFGAEGMRLAEAAVDALRDAAMGGHDGRNAARAALLSLIDDPRTYPPLRAGTPPMRLAHMALWRLQALARSTDATLDRELWRNRLGW